MTRCRHSTEFERWLNSGAQLSPQNIICLHLSFLYPALSGYMNFWFKKKKNTNLCIPIAIVRTALFITSVHQTWATPFIISNTKQYSLLHSLPNFYLHYSQKTSSANLSQSKALQNMNFFFLFLITLKFKVFSKAFCLPFPPV